VGHDQYRRDPSRRRLWSRAGEQEPAGRGDRCRLEATRRTVGPQSTRRPGYGWGRLLLLRLATVKLSEAAGIAVRGQVVPITFNVHDAGQANRAVAMPRIAHLAWWRLLHLPFTGLSHATRVRSGAGRPTRSRRCHVQGRPLRRHQGSRLLPILGASGARTGSWRVPPRQLGWRRAGSTTVGMAFRRPGGGVAAGLGFCWGSVPACLPSSTPFYLVKCGGAEGI
jgi:hypothetical protein